MRSIGRILAAGPARKSRLAAALVIGALLWVPNSVRTVSAIYCFPGDPPAVYQACVAYNNGIGQQVANEQALLNIQASINGVEAQMNALSALMNNLNNQISAQKALIAQTQANIDDLNRRIRLGEADLTLLQSHLAVRDQLLNQRLRYVDNHGAINYVQLVLTASSFNDLMNRMIGAQQIAAADKRLLNELHDERTLVSQANFDLGLQRDEVTALLQQQKATQADLEKTLAAQAAAFEYQKQLAVKLSGEYQQIQAQRAAIDAQVAALAVKYEAAASAAGGGTGQFEWPIPTCGHSCISQGFGCNSYWFEQYEPSCPYPNRIHTGIDIAASWGSLVVAADTGIIYMYPGSYGYGNYIVIIHGNGYSTLYGHLAQFASGLQSGQIVARGTAIALEGSTGNSTGPHLHFEIRVNNVWKDPCLWLGC
ncbi:MAG TPA: peptidoglycan DD-metalloendopeptidase family protein [Candidatus Dormibacteraeota bacterium]|nr:peptidoglycan DD-metalloendopeptidase family protein [Candidatus Dormibacteraeota bacterium]